jgi:hypothetical protein
MTQPNLFARAELFLGSDRMTAQAQGGRRFSTAANAVRFAMEEAAPVSLRGALLLIGAVEYAGPEIAQLYGDLAFPLPRKSQIQERFRASYS